MSNEKPIEISIPSTGTHYVPKPAVSDTTIEAAAHNISVVKKGKLGEDEIADLLKFLAEGTTERKIINYFRRTHDRVISSHTIRSYKEKYSSRIMEAAQNIENFAIEAGLTKRSMRLMKLQELAEAVESRIFNTNGELGEHASAKLLAEYRAVLAQIATETGDFSTQTVGDINFIGLSDEQLKSMVAAKLSGNKDLAVVLAERAGVRPQLPTGEDDERSECNNQSTGLQKSVSCFDAADDSDIIELRKFHECGVYSRPGDKVDEDDGGSD